MEANGNVNHLEDNLNNQLDNQSLDNQLENQLDNQLSSDVDIPKVSSTDPRRISEAGLFDRMAIRNRIGPLPALTISAQKQQKVAVKPKLNFEVRWRSLSYQVDQRWPRIVNKMIIYNLNGYFRSGQMTALMGPSGAGKSTLLDCICGRKATGVTGDVTIEGVDKIKIGMVPQDNHLLEKLTVFEAIVFAFKLRYGPDGASDKANKYLKQFHLDHIKNTSTDRCSGGQRKLLSIALEILGKPSILILDEPTTGLDSASCSYVVKLLASLSKDDGIAVVATIHQPSNNVFNAFDQVYVLSFNGQCVYSGPPRQMIESLSKFQLNCPTTHSPADYVIEVASAEHGREVVDKLNVFERNKSRLPSTDARPLAASLSRQKHPVWYNTWVLLHRSILTTYRNPFVTHVRIGITLFCAYSIATLFGPDVGNSSGCPIPPEQLFTMDIMNMSQYVVDEFLRLMANVGMLFLGMMLSLMGSLAPLIMTYPMEMLCFIKEYKNDHYSCVSYYLAKSIADVPLQIIVPLLYTGITYHMTGQPNAWDREAKLIGLTVLMSLVSQAMGQCFSAMMAHHVQVAVFIGPMLMMPMMLFGGFLVKIKRMPAYFQPLSWFSFLRFAYEAMLINMYGNGRCQYQRQKIIDQLGQNITTMKTPKWFAIVPTLLNQMEQMTGGGKEIDDSEDVSVYDNPEKYIEKLMSLFGGSMGGGGEFDMNKSMILDYYDLNDSHLMRGVVILSIYFSVFQITTYFALIWQLR